MENGKTQSNPARLLRRKHEDNGRVRFLNQFQPGETETDFLKDCNAEESRLRAVIGKKYPSHLPELEIAVHTGVRPPSWAPTKHYSEQQEQQDAAYSLELGRPDGIQHVAAARGGRPWPGFC
jgi:hypothetical protein